MKALLIAIAFLFAPIGARAIPAPAPFLTDDMDLDRTTELNNPARRGSISDEINNREKTLQNRTNNKTKLSRDKNRAIDTTTPAQNCSPNDVQCMRTQDVEKGVR